MSKIVQVSQYEQITIENTNNISKFMLEFVLKDITRYSIANAKNVIFGESSNIIEQNTGSDYNVKINPHFAIDITGKPIIRTDQILKIISIPVSNPRIDIVQIELGYTDQNQQSRQFIDPNTDNWTSIPETRLEFHLTGTDINDSISEYVGVPAQSIIDGSRFKFHAAGREDIDALMLGDGRPFVVEITEPRIRTPDLEEIAKSINKEAEGKIEVHNLVLTDRFKLQKLKEDASTNVKEYEALIETEKPVTAKELKKVEKEFKGVEIEQRTPHRVSHRRADLVRKKAVHEISLKKHKDGLLKATFKVQGGTYIKELISGDEGRTIPSIAEKLGTSCKCAELNVTAIYSEDS